jgi:endonuclease/exonuclease/phosphatase family metal-dependent hydrolase
MGIPCPRFIASAALVVTAALSLVAGCSSHEQMETALASAALVKTNVAAGSAVPIAGSAMTVPWTQSAAAAPLRISPVQPNRKATASTYVPGRAMTTLSSELPGDGKPKKLALNETPADLRVMTFNLRVPFVLDATNHWSFRKRNVIKTIENFSPDILGTQEVVAEQADYLRDNLPDYNFRGVGRGDGMRQGEFAAILYRRDRFKELDHGYFWLSETPEVPGSKSWGAWSTRICSWVKLQPTDGGAAFAVFNAHMDNMSGRAREMSSRLMRERIGSIASNMPVIVTGDFNADAGTEPYRLLLAGATAGVPQLLFDAFRLANPRVTGQEGTHHNFNGGRGGDRIDWILCTTAFTPVSGEINRWRGMLGYPSDHFPVQVILRPVVPTKPMMPVAGL